MMLKVLALLFVSLSATRALPQDFTVSLSSLTVALDDNTPTSEAIKFAYSYLGPTTDEDGMVSMEYAIYEGGCGTIYADDANTQNAALYRNLIDQNGANNTVDVNVEIDLATIEAATGIWQQASNTYAELHFCGRLEIYFGDNSANAPKTFVNYHETDVEAQITLTEAGGMHVDNVIWDLVERAEDSNLDNAVQVDYPVVVFKCDENAIADPTADTAVNQGDEINLCVKYAGSVDKVYVESIDKFSYWSVLKSDGLSPTTPELVWENGNAKNLVIDVTCNQELGVCRINFLVDASLFIDAPAAAMQLQVNGLAVIAFGTDPGRRQLINLRDLTEGEGGMEMTEFDMDVGTIIPAHDSIVTSESETSKPAARAVTLTLTFVFGFAGAALAIWFFFQKSQIAQGAVKTIDMAIPVGNGRSGNSPYQDTPKQQDLLHDISLNARQTV